MIRPLKGLLKGLAAGLDKEIASGNVHANLYHLVFDVVGQIVEFQENIDIHNALTVAGQFGNFFFYAVKQRSVSVKVHRLNFDIHNTGFEDE